MATPAAGLYGNMIGGNGAALLSDEMLISQIASGGKSAMRVLFARHQVKIYRFVLRILRDAALAEDAVSETFIDAWRHADRYAGRSSVATWLLGIARHRALRAARRRPTESLDCEAAQNAVDPAGDPEAQLGQRDTGASVARSRRCRASMPRSSTWSIIRRGRSGRSPRFSASRRAP